MKKIILTMILFLISEMQISTATSVVLTSDKTELMINETITFHLEVRPSEAISGSFTIQKEIGDKKFKLLRTYARTSCTICKGLRSLGDIERDIHFMPTEAGNYRAEANYGGVQKKIDFKVFESVVTSTTTSSTTTSTSTTTITTLTSTTTTSTSITTTIPIVSEEGYSKLLYILGFALFLFIVFFIYRRK